MDDGSLKIELAEGELRAVAGYAARCARAALEIFERDCAGDVRPREAIQAAEGFAEGGRRTKGIRDAAWAAQRASHAARDAGLLGASEAGRAALASAGAVFLHPLAKATQVKHILGAAGHAARAFELAEGSTAGAAKLAEFGSLADRVVVGVLRRYPRAPGGGGRVGELVRELDAMLR